jgi:hypothetical protein
MTLEQLTTKLELNILIEKVLQKSGAYKTPLSKEEALKGVQLSQTTKDTLHTLKSALEWITLSEDLVNDYRKKVQELENDKYKLSVENSKLRTRANYTEQKNKNLLDHVELNKDKL